MYRRPESLALGCWGLLIKTVLLGLCAPLWPPRPVSACGGDAQLGLGGGGVGVPSAVNQQGLMSRNLRAVPGGAADAVAAAGFVGPPVLTAFQQFCLPSVHPCVRVAN